ncbi:uncharacterized protein LOC141556457 [Sminthopsis crassicaudata]|uniref:uncharacterized protein LOC141556457 n=1 Tax=Sminthopsis crassicaudata TaxID=9301 RepID=UPI003D68025F
MAWPLVCLLLLSFCSGSFSQLTQPPSLSVSLGASARLSCTLSSAYTGNTIAWHQQSPGKAPRFLMYVSSSGSVSKGEGVPARFSGSASGADRYLSISSVQPEDEADYYCQTYSSGYSYHSATFSGEVGQKPPWPPLPRPTAAPTSGPAPAAEGPGLCFLFLCVRLRAQCPALAQEHAGSESQKWGLCLPVSSTFLFPSDFPGHGLQGRALAEPQAVAGGGGEGPSVPPVPGCSHKENPCLSKSGRMNLRPQVV